MIVEQLLPENINIELSEVLMALSGTCPFEPFSVEVISFCTAVSDALFADVEARQYAELQALAFFMRASAINDMRQQFDKVGSAETICVPRGLVFHLPPANVDSIFVYSWLMSALAGNANIIRLSNRRAKQTDILLRLFNDVLAKQPEAIAKTLTIISYGHEEEITRAITDCCAVRVVWGGDETVSNIRQIPLPPQSKEVVFPNRYSLSMLKAKPYLQLNERKQDELVEHFYNDSYWFDQAGCSSPRLVIWVGVNEDVRAADKSFWTRLEAIIEQKQYALTAGGALKKYTATCEAVIDEPVSSYRTLSNELTLLDLKSLSGLSRKHPGMGLFYQYAVADLLDLVPHIKSADQTLTTFGFADSELVNLVRALNGKGLDRIVPIGHALAFSRFWDGYDLLSEFMRIVFVGKAQALPKSVGHDLNV
jgi:hypothetical protein